MTVVPLNVESMDPSSCKFVLAFLNEVIKASLILGNVLQFEIFYNKISTS